MDVPSRDVWRYIVLKYCIFPRVFVAKVFSPFTWDLELTCVVSPRDLRGRIRLWLYSFLPSKDPGRQFSPERWVLTDTLKKGPFL